MGGNRYKDGAAAPILGNQLILSQLLLYLIHVGAWLINLIDGHNDFHIGCLCVVDGLNCLRHYTVVRSHYQDGNVRGLCSSHTHGRKCLMARRIQKRNLAVVYLNDRRTNMLGDAACLSCSHVGLTDGVQKGGFTMVNMAHNTHNR